MASLSKGNIFWHAHPGGAKGCIHPPQDSWACPYPTKASAQKAAKLFPAGPGVRVARLPGGNSYHGPDPLGPDVSLTLPLAGPRAAANAAHDDIAYWMFAGLVGNQ